MAGSCGQGELDLPCHGHWFLAFHRMGSHLIINLECKHRFHRENGIYAFRIDLADKLVLGGPAVAERILADAGELQADMIATEAKNAEQAGAGQPATRPQSKAEGGDKPQPESEGRSR